MNAARCIGGQNKIIIINNNINNLIQQLPRQSTPWRGKGDGDCVAV